MHEPIAARPFKDAIPKRRQQAEQERNAAYDLAAAKARRLWRRARPANDSHAFLVSRCIGRHEVRQFRDVLIVPVVNANEDLVSLHLVAADGTQRFLKGSRVAGGFYVLGGDAVTPSAIIITEGFAAAASIHEATGLSVVVAFLRDNLAAVAEVWRQKRPDARIVIAATDDWCAETHGNTLGIAKAAAAAFGAVVAVPDFAVTERQLCDTDFNGLARLRGLAEVKRQIETAVEQSA